MSATAETAAAPPVIRKAAGDDVDAVARIWHVGWADGHAGHVPPDLLRRRGEEQFRSRARERLDSMWVAEVAREIVGFAVVKDDEVEQVYVDRASRGTGVAVVLLRKGEDEVRQAGYRRAWLAVAAGNHRARAFYTRSGWRDAGPFTYMAETESGPFAVPCNRYEIDLDESVPR